MIGPINPMDALPIHISSSATIPKISSPEFLKFSFLVIPPSRLPVIVSILDHYISFYGFTATTLPLTFAMSSLHLNF